ncbi:hypothetical protein TNCT_410341 [Trichonephila clavata]|uniref:Uncharacterized protein n=1 Tax=Trichonephila clavata TaxID=2740835 RepID=A0A8X6IX35_TRICU|nr:hypothetical protein TNCT_410341 [Trichonephila clavata]
MKRGHSHADIFHPNQKPLLRKFLFHSSYSRQFGLPDYPLVRVSTRIRSRQTAEAQTIADRCLFLPTTQEF